MKNRILILGAIASGKTLLARNLSLSTDLPIVHVDSLEFNFDLSKKNINEVRSAILSKTSEEKWILDGHGPLDLLPKHLKDAEVIVFLDFPLYLNILWLLKRQLRILFQPRPEMPKGVNEWNWVHFRKLFQTLKKQHRLMNPELRKILQKPEFKEKVIVIKNKKEFLKISLE